MGWLRLVGSLKLQVSFAEYHLFYRALLQKRPILWRSLPIVGTPYHVAAPEPRSGKRATDTSSDEIYEMVLLGEVTPKELYKRALQKSHWNV